MIITHGLYRGHCKRHQYRITPSDFFATQLGTNLRQLLLLLVIDLIIFLIRTSTILVIIIRALLGLCFVVIRTYFNGRRFSLDFILSDIRLRVLFRRISRLFVPSFDYVYFTNTSILKFYVGRLSNYCM